MIIIPKPMSSKKRKRCHLKWCSRRKMQLPDFQKTSLTVCCSRTNTHAWHSQHFWIQINRRPCNKGFLSSIIKILFSREGRRKSRRRLCLLLILILVTISSHSRLKIRLLNQLWGINLTKKRERWKLMFNSSQRMCLAKIQNLNG